VTTNGKSYTEVVLEFTDRQNASEKEILRQLAESERRQVNRLDAIALHNSKVMEALARGDEKFKSQDKRIDKNDDRLDDHDDDFKEVRRNQKWLGLGEGGIFVLLGWLGFGK